MTVRSPNDLYTRSDRQAFPGTIRGENWYTTLLGGCEARTVAERKIEGPCL